MEHTWNHTGHTDSHMGHTWNPMRHNFNHMGHAWDHMDILGTTGHILRTTWDILGTTWDILETKWYILFYVVCVLYVTQFFPGNTSKFLCQIKSDLHETFSICQDWSPELINNVCGPAYTHVQGGSRMPKKLGAVRNMKGASMLDLISQATYIG